MRTIRELKIKRKGNNQRFAAKCIQLFFFDSPLLQTRLNDNSIAVGLDKCPLKEFWELHSAQQEEKNFKTILFSELQKAKKIFKGSPVGIQD